MGPSVPFANEKRGREGGFLLLFYGEVCGFCCGLLKVCGFCGLLKGRKVIQVSDSEETMSNPCSNDYIRHLMKARNLPIGKNSRR